MKIPVVGFDPSLNHWGIALGDLDLTTGYLDTPHLDVIEPEKLEGKQVRQNSTDLFVGEQLAKTALAYARKAKAVFVEVPVGSQNYRSAVSYGLCVGILAAIQAEGIPLIEVNPAEVKRNFTGYKEATKAQMIKAAMDFYPDANWPTRGGKITAGKAEHMADAIASIHAGVNTPLFKSLIRLYQTPGQQTSTQP